MRKKAIFLLIFVIIISFSITTAQATDLPIDINAIKDQTGYGDAITKNFKIDILTTNAAETSKIIAEHKHRKSAQTVSELFETVYVIEEADLSDEIKNAADKAGLFAQPVNSGSLTKAKEENTISVWLIILLLAICSAIGFVWSFISRRRRTSGVH